MSEQVDTAHHEDDDPFGWRSGLVSWSVSQAQLSAAPLSEVSDAAFDDLSVKKYRKNDFSSPSKRYEKTALLGQGGMGRVWLAWDHDLSRHVAIKEPLGDARSMVAEKLVEESLLCAVLEHPLIVKIYDIYHDEDRPHVVMELVRGEPLSELLSKLPSHDRAARTRYLRTILDVCEAVGHAHRHRVIHRDLSPRNILVDSQGAAHLIDWGLAISLDKARHVPQPAGLGTRGFAPPEQRLGLPVSLSADVWSLGALLHTVLFGAPPLHQPHMSGADPELMAILWRALQDDPAQRYTDASHMARDLRAWLEGRTVEAYHTSSARQVRHLVKTHWRTIALISGALLSLITALSWGIWSTRREAALTHQAEIKTRATLAGTFHQRAATRLAQGDLYRASLDLSESLALADSPEARGIATQLLAIAHPVMTSSQPLPPCKLGWHLSDTHPTLPVCHQSEREVQVWRDGALLWSHQAPYVTVVRAHHDRVYVLDNQRLLSIFDITTGELLGHEPALISPLASFWGMSQRVSGTRRTP